MPLTAITRKVSPAINVYCYEGYMAEQEPRRFSLGQQIIEVERIVDRWQGPDHRYFKVKGSNRSSYILRYDQQINQWDLVYLDLTDVQDKEPPP